MCLSKDSAGRYQESFRCNLLSIEFLCTCAPLLSPPVDPAAGTAAAGTDSKDLVFSFSPPPDPTPSVPMARISSQTLKTASMASGRDRIETATDASEASELEPHTGMNMTRPREVPATGSRNTLVEPEAGGSASHSHSPSPFNGSRHSCCTCWTKCEMPQSLLSDPNVFVLRLEDVPEHFVQQQSPTSTSATDASLGFAHTYSVPMRMTLPEVERVLKTATKSSVSRSPIFFTVDPSSPAESSALSAASDASANNMDSMSQLQPPQEFTSTAVEFAMPQQNPNQTLLPSGAGGGLPWARNTAAVVLSTKLPDASALGRLRLLQEILSIVDPSAADLDTPIVEREKGQPQDVYTLRQLIAALPSVLIDESLDSLKLDWLE